jgi:hypothetical protein
VEAATGPLLAARSRRARSGNSVQRLGTVSRARCLRAAFGSPSASGSGEDAQPPAATAASKRRIPAIRPIMLAPAFPLVRLVMLSGIRASVNDGALRCAEGSTPAPAGIVAPDAWREVQVHRGSRGSRPRGGSPPAAAYVPGSEDTRPTSTHSSLSTPTSPRHALL